MIKRLIFDVDNTLITNVNYNDAIKNTLIDLDIYSEERIKGFLKCINTYENIYNSYNKTDYIKYMSQCINFQLDDIFLEIFFKHLKNAIPEKNEILIKCIEKLATKYELVLLTNYFRVSQMNRLNGMKIGKFFRECYGEEIIKPYSKAYLMACGKYNPRECVMIGDDLYLDIKCSQKCGLNTIWVNTKKMPIEKVNTIVVNKVEEINSKLIESI